MNQLLEGDYLQSNLKDEKRFIRSSQKKDDSNSAHSSDDDDNSSDDFKKSSGSNDIETTMIIDEICNSDVLANNSNKVSMTVREKLFCQLLKKLSKLNTGSQVKSKSGGDQYLPEDYNKFEAPKAKYNLTLRNKKVITIEKPVSCEVFLNVRGIVDFNEEDEVGKHKNYFMFLITFLNFT